MNKINKQTNRAQSMVEFALVLPILMMLVFGLLEVGRLAFVYMTIVTASREAVRYGSATGKNIAESSLRYADCSGIRQAALNVDFLKAIGNVNNIEIYYYHGNNNYPDYYATCPVDGTGPSSIISGDRIHVIVSGDFVPIVGLIPLSTRTITSSNYHTLLGVVEIEYPTGTAGPTHTPFPTLTPLPTSTPKKDPTATNTPPGPSATPSCVITSGVPVISGNYSSISWTIQNNNSFDLVIKTISVNWPAGSGTLTNITIDSNIYPLNLNPPSQIITTISQPLGLGSHTFVFEFKNNPLSGLFQVSVGFSNDKCSSEQKAITVYPVTHSGTFPGAPLNGTTTGTWTLYNHTDQNLKIASIEITFPCAHQNDLLSLTFAGQSWSGSGYVSSCQGTIVTPLNMFIPTGTSGMTLTFNNYNVTGITVKVFLQCYGEGVTTTCQTVDSTIAAQMTSP